MRSFASCTLPCLLLLLLVSHVQADILFSQPVISGGVALASDFARFQQEADNFALPQAASVETIHWWGAYANNVIRTDNFTLRFFGAVAGNPAVMPLVDLSAVSLACTPTNLFNNLGDQIYEYQAAFPSPLTLNEATTYYLSVVNNTPPGGVWDWVGSGPGRTGLGRMTGPRGPLPAARPALPLNCSARLFRNRPPSQSSASAALLCSLIVGGGGACLTAG